MKAISHFYVAILLFTFLGATSAQVPLPYHTKKHALQTSEFTGATGLDAKGFTATRKRIQIPDATWLVLRFSDYHLGDSSYIRITAIQDGATQVLYAEDLKRWNRSTARFNGGTVEIELFVAPFDTGIFFELDDVLVGESFSEENEGAQESICGNQDDRAPSNDAAIGRIMPASCTGWLTANGAFLTAGHCTNGTGNNMRTIEFGVPPSNANGFPVAPPPQNQYPIINTSIIFFNGGEGDDWAVFDVGRNANTGLLPIQAQRAFYRLSLDDNNIDNIRITGYGVDNMPAGPGNGTGLPINTTCRDCNSASLTQQTHRGSYEGQNIDGRCDAFVEYKTDTRNGNSGSPIIKDGSSLTIGIHTEGHCDEADRLVNSGTSFLNRCLRNTIENFPSPNTTYVDAGHPSALEDGTVFRPFDTFIEGINSVSAGGLLSIVRGNYIQAITITKPMTITAPVGVVTISSN